MHGVGVVLTRGQRPIAFFSKVLSLHTQAKSAYERELIAIVIVVQHWRSYLLGRRFMVRTDQQSLKYIVERTVIQLEYHIWVSKLLDYDFEVQRKPDA